jgi:parvulin-like peptidyl-prolyl isomerase
MNTRSFAGLFLIAALSIAGGCRHREEAVIAKIDGDKITLSDFRDRMNETPTAYQQYMVSPEGRRQFLDLLIREKVLLIEARKSGAQFDADYEKAVSQFKKQLARRMKDFEESMLVETYLKKLRTRELAVSNADVEKYYNDHLSEFQHPAQILAAHVLLNSQADAERALDRIKKGESFEKVAREMSMDPATAAQGGRLSPFRKGQLVPEFENAVMQLKNGQISPIVKSHFGYHIIKKLGEKPLPPEPLDQAKEDIRSRLERERFDVWVTKAQNSLKVRVDEKELASASAPAGPMMAPPQEMPQ